MRVHFHKSKVAIGRFGADTDKNQDYISKIGKIQRCRTGASKIENKSGAMRADFYIINQKGRKKTGKKA